MLWTYTVYPNRPVARIRFSVKGWRFRVGERDRDAFGELVEAGIMRGRMARISDSPKEAGSGERSYSPPARRSLRSLEPRLPDRLELFFRQGERWRGIWRAIMRSPTPIAETTVNWRGRGSWSRSGHSRRAMTASSNLPGRVGSPERLSAPPCVAFLPPLFPGAFPGPSHGSSEAFPPRTEPLPNGGCRMPRRAHAQ